ncbi:hypothetical protein U1Q18_025126 [Sarracenia purpurea var. burkii]
MKYLQGITVGAYGYCILEENCLSGKALLLNLMEHLNNIPITKNKGDWPRWKGDKEGVFLIKSFVRCMELKSVQGESEIAKVWDKLASLDRVPLKELLASRSILPHNISVACTMCEQAIESTRHLISTCYDYGSDWGGLLGCSWSGVVEAMEFTVAILGCSCFGWGAWLLAVACSVVGLAKGVGQESLLWVDFRHKFYGELNSPFDRNAQTAGERKATEESLLQKASGGPRNHFRYERRRWSYAFLTALRSGPYVEIRVREETRWESKLKQIQRSRRRGD